MQRRMIYRMQGQCTYSPFFLPHAHAETETERKTEYTDPACLHLTATYSMHPSLVHAPLANKQSAGQACGLAISGSCHRPAAKCLRATRVTYATTQVRQWHAHRGCRAQAFQGLAEASHVPQTQSEAFPATACASHSPYPERSCTNLSR